MDKVFKSSLYRSSLEVRDGTVWANDGGIFGSKEVGVQLRRIKSVEIDTGVFYCDIVVNQSGGEPLVSRGHPKSHGPAFKAALEAQRGPRRQGVSLNE
jgi:hypothetical protein